MLFVLSKFQLYWLIGCYIRLFQECNSSPVLVLVANGSDITINFPGENNNNRVFSIVSSSGNNNPSMFDWIGGNGANKAPSITLGKSNAPEFPSTASDEDTADESFITPLPSNTSAKRWEPRGTNELDEIDGLLPVVPSVTPTLPANTTISSAPDAPIETTDRL